MEIGMAGWSVESWVNSKVAKMAERTVDLMAAHLVGC